MAEKLLTVREAAEYLGIGVITLRNWCRDGGLTYHKIHNTRIRFYQSDLDAFVAKGRREAIQKPEPPAESDIPVEQDATEDAEAAE